MLHLLQEESRELFSSEGSPLVPFRPSDQDGLERVKY